MEVQGESLLGGMHHVGSHIGLGREGSIWEAESWSLNRVSLPSGVDLGKLLRLSEYS